MLVYPFACPERNLGRLVNWLCLMLALDLVQSWFCFCWCWQILKNGPLYPIQEGLWCLPYCSLIFQRSGSICIGTKVNHIRSLHWVPEPLLVDSLEDVWHVQMSFNFNSIEHPQMDSQAEVVNRSLGNLVCCIYGRNLDFGIMLCTKLSLHSTMQSTAPLGDYHF